MRSAAVFALFTASTLAAQPLRAQDPPPTGPPAVGAEAPDTVVVDSTQLRIRQRLQLLNRGPGSDSARAQAYADSLESGEESRNSRFATEERGEPDAQDHYAVLRVLPGYDITEFTGHSAEYSTVDEMLVLYGDSTVDASVTMNDGRLTAKESIRFNEASEEMEALGQPVFLPAEGDEIQADGLIWRANEDVGAARQARMQYSEGAEWNITSDFPEITPGRAYGHDAMFTSCTHDEPHYHFRTSQLKIVRGRILVAKSVRLYFGDVPVAWLPFIAQGLGRGRSSGLLTPRFSVNDIVRTSGGYRRRLSNLGYYWAMSDYSDASLALDWFDDNYTAITGTARYRWARRFMQGSLSFRQFWRAEGGTELTLNTSHQWQMSERTNLNMRVAFASSSRFVAQNSFNPTEVTQSIDSEGGLQRRFDWGNLAVSGNRRQFLSDDRVEQTFPSVNLSLSTITLFPAPQGRAGFFNNITLSGGGSLRRSTTIRGAGDTQPDAGTLDGSLRSALNFGRLSVGGGMQYRESSQFGARVNTRGVPRTDSIGAVADLPSEIAERGAQVFDDPLLRQVLLQEYGNLADIADTRLTWNASIDYQQNLIGSTTFTPRVSWDSELRRADTLALAQDFVSGPTRVSFGANLRSDIYGFFPGVGPWERIRHKISPSFSYSYSPEVTPTDLQRQVFGSSVINPRNVLNIGLNQTFEGRKRAPEVEEGDSAALGGLNAPQQTDDGFTIPERAETEVLLGIQTSALAYDFVADSTGRIVDGFTTASLNNTIRSDYLRGLAISMRHDLFDEGQPGADGSPAQKRFAPHLEGMNFNYGFSSRSSLFRWLGLGGGGGGGDEVRDPFARPEEADPGSVAAAQESLVPTTSRPERIETGQNSAVGSWNVSLGYSLIRPRATSTSRASQNVTINMGLVPTESWDMSWRTSYDLENGGFNDHTIRLTRELHRWEANFDFLQTATGNWTFRFEVRLIDNQDLKFDYQQQTLARDDGFVGDFGGGFGR